MSLVFLFGIIWMPMGYLLFLSITQVCIFCNINHLQIKNILIWFESLSKLFYNVGCDAAWQRYLQQIN